MNGSAIYFADTWFWIARISKGDQHHATVAALHKKIGRASIVTSEMVLTELLNMFASRGSHLRKAACTYIGLLRRDKAITIVPHTAERFQAALEKYRLHDDKKWSHTDCASFVIMEERHIQLALTDDEHFEQAGFTLAK